MMHLVPIIPSLIATVFAFCIAMMSLVTLQKYTRTYFLLMNYWRFYAYGLIYALIAALIVYFVPPNTLSMPNAWVEAIAVGCSTRAFLNIVLISFPKPDGSKLDGDEPIHFGSHFISAFIEFFILPEIRSYYEQRLKQFLENKTQHYTSSECVKERILSNLPTYIEDDDSKKRVFHLDIEKPLKDDPSTSEYVKVRRIMIAFLNFVGKDYFNSLFTCEPDSHMSTCTCRGRLGNTSGPSNITDAGMAEPVD